MSENDDLRWLSSAMSIEPDGPDRWRPEELAEMLLHQLAAPIGEDVWRLSEELARRYDQEMTRVSDAGGAAMTFGELFGASGPPVEVLRIVKDYAKQSISISDGPMPEELGAALYYASISCALLRCGQRISSLDQQAMREGLNWALGQSWLNDSLRALFQECGRGIFTS